MSATTWLVADAVVLGDGSAPRADTAVGVRDGRIVEVLPADALDLAARRASRDLGAATLAPGFIDAHVHLLFSCDTDHERTRRRFVEAPDAELAAAGARNALECLLGGVTTVRDLGDSRWIVRALRDAVARGTLPGPRILTAGAPLTTPTGHLNWCGNVAESPEEVRTAVTGLLEGGADVVKIMSSGGNMTRESDPLTPQFTLEALEEAVRLAHGAGRRVAAHSQNAEAIRRCIAAGVDTLEHCLWREADGSPADPAALVAALRTGSSTIVITLAGIARALLPDALGFTREELDAARAISPTGDLAADFAWARVVRDAGIPIVVASDAGVRFTPFRRFPDTVRAAQVALGIAPSDAIHTVTGLAARALGLDDEVGTLAPGSRADLVVLDGADIEHRMGEVAAVYLAGRPAVEAGSVLLPDLPS